jgi:hypothetical protein
MNPETRILQIDVKHRLGNKILNKKLLIKNSGAEYFASFEKKIRRNFRKFRPGIPSFSDSQLLYRSKKIYVDI